MTVVQRVLGTALFGYGLYITVTCPCQPLWKCHRLEISLTIAALSLLTNLEMAGLLESSNAVAGT